MSTSNLRFAPLVFVLVSFAARADTVADWADITTRIATDGPNSVRTMALAQSAVYAAVNAITSRYPRDHVDLGSAKDASMDAAIAAASRTVLLHEAPVLKPQTEAAYTHAVDAIADSEAKTRGISLGERAAADVLAKHTDDIGKIEPYRPLTTPGAYVPTTFPQGYAAAQHRPWIMKSASQFRPGPPPALSSALWARDYNEIKSVGSATSTVRTAEQSDVAIFWATSLPDVFLGLLRSVDIAPAREVTRNARLYAAATAAMSDAEIAVLEAKYHYEFWRPITAIRNGDRDNNSATERDADWAPLIVTPIQPEYPCGNCVYAALFAAVIRAEAGPDPLPTLSTISNTAPGVTRHWTRPEDMVQEVSESRIRLGVHFRNSTEVGNHMGEQIAVLMISAYRLP
jgi:hypothetical protein